MNKNMTKVVVNPSRSEDKKLCRFIASLPSIFEEQGDVLFWGRNKIKKFSLNSDSDSEDLVVKRFKKPNVFQKIVYSFFRKSKAERAFVNAASLKNRGFSTPYGIAYIEEKNCGLLSYGYFVTDLTADSSIDAELHKSSAFNKTIATAFASYVAALHKNGVLHHDLNPSNVLYHKEGDGSLAFSLIDINRMTFYPEGEEIPVEACFKNLNRFTGDMELFRFVLACYIEERGWDKCLLSDAMRIKKQWDKAWRRRKDFFNHFKRKNV